jgi:uncharacterized protein (TIGR02452 family)
MEPVFADTLTLSKAFPPGKAYRYDAPLINWTPPSGHDTAVRIANVDCVDECLALRARFPDRKIGLLNMASDVCPGGGVKKGSKAQEEDICRRTTLYPTLKPEWYHLKGAAMIYSEDVWIVKAGGKSDYARLREPVKLDGVLSVPAIRRPDKTPTDEYRHDADRRLMRTKIRMTLQTAAYHGLDVLVLGAHGLGVFRNPKREVAGMFADLLVHEFKGAFAHVSFAILEPAGGDLCATFREAFTR